MAQDENDKHVTDPHEKELNKNQEENGKTTESDSEENQSEEAKENNVVAKKEEHIEEKATLDKDQPLEPEGQPQEEKEEAGVIATKREEEQNDPEPKEASDENDDIKEETEVVSEDRVAKNLTVEEKESDGVTEKSSDKEVVTDEENIAEKATLEKDEPLETEGQPQEEKEEAEIAATTKEEELSDPEKEKVSEKTDIVSEDPVTKIQPEEEKEESNSDTLSKEEEPSEKEEVVEIENKGESASKSDDTGSTESDKEGGDDGDNDDEIEEHHLDYSNYSKTQLVQAIETQLKNTDMSEVGKILKEIKPAFDDVHNHEREDAYQKYLEAGGEKDGFEYKNDELDSRFLEAYNALRDKRNEFYNSLEKQKDQNLHKKQAILEKLRSIVDSDETMASLKELKEIQEEWKNTGPVAPQHLKSLWANYNALIDRYYDQRSIYFELKELDRKKNLEAKLELCEKAEELDKMDNLKEAIKVLNELHEEFKHIGPVPKEDQEPLWIRFKAASDAVYAKRKDYYENLKEELNLNQKSKEALVEKVQFFSDFNSERISDWNQKTKELLEIQKQWEAIGGLPREVAKDINKKFWSAFKSFFSHKGQFFKELEKKRQENLHLKEELTKQAEELKDNENFQETAETLKELQRKWRDIGPVPEKFRNEIYAKFKSACDHFFNRKRANENVQEKQYVENLKKKQVLCDELDKMATSGDIDLDRVDDIIDEWPKIGYVPKNEIKNIQNRFNKAIATVVDKADLDEDEAQQMKFSAQFSKLKQSPNSNRIIQKKENSLRRQIAKLENDIDLWKNNLNFFADSKKADKLKEEFNEKIEKASRELQTLEEQLRAISNI